MVCANSVTNVGATWLMNGSESGANFSAGGFSNYFATPSYQADAVQTYFDSIGDANAGLYNSSGRGYPDVSAIGYNVDIVAGGDFLPVFGTSISSPVFASVIALINDMLLSEGKSALGFLNPWLYANPGAFNDIETGM